VTVTSTPGNGPVILPLVDSTVPEIVPVVRSSVKSSVTGELVVETEIPLLTFS
jgi:hypothetical protein